MVKPPLYIKERGLERSPTRMQTHPHQPDPAACIIIIISLMSHTMDMWLASGRHAPQHRMTGGTKPQVGFSCEPSKSIVPS